MLIVPIGHYPSSWHMQAMQGPEADEAKASLKEIDEVRGRLTKTFGKMGSVTVGYELFAGGSGEDGKLMHMHQQVRNLSQDSSFNAGPYPCGLTETSAATDRTHTRRIVG